MLLDAIYAKGFKQPPIEEQNVDMILELARKYDVENLSDFCDVFLSELQLTNENFRKFYILADTYHLERSLAHCRKFVGPSFRELSR